VPEVSELLVKVKAEEEVVPVVAVKAAKVVKVVSEEQLTAREIDARNQAELAARQAAEVQAKQERSKRKAASFQVPEPVVVAKPVTPVVEKVEKGKPEAALAKPALPEGTLHRPAPKPGDKIVRPTVAKKVDKEAEKASPWDQAGHKKRTPSRTVDARAGVGVRTGGSVRAPRHEKHSKEDSATQHAFSLPTEAIVQEVTVPETITVAELAQKMSIKHFRLFISIPCVKQLRRGLF